MWAQLRSLGMVVTSSESLWKYKGVTGRPIIRLIRRVFNYLYSSNNLMQNFLGLFTQCTNEVLLPFIQNHIRINAGPCFAEPCRYLGGEGAFRINVVSQSKTGTLVPTPPPHTSWYILLTIFDPYFLSGVAVQNQSWVGEEAKPSYIRERHKSANTVTTLNYWEETFGFLKNTLKDDQT